MFTTKAVAREADRSVRAVVHAMKYAVEREMITPEKYGRDWLFTVGQKDILLSLMTGQGTPRENVDTEKRLRGELF